MAVTAVTFYRGAASTTTSTTLYTTAATGTAIVTNIMITNTSGSVQTFTIGIDGTSLFTTTAIAANSTAFFDLKHPIVTTGSTKTITGGASATSVNLFIGGVTL